MADGEGAGGLNLSPSILSDYTGTVAAGSEEGGKKRSASACVDKTARPLTSQALPGRRQADVTATAAAGHICKA